MNEKLELLNALQAELEGMGIRIAAISVRQERRFDRDGQMDEVTISVLSMPCQSGFYHAECHENGPGSYEIRVVREIIAQIRTIPSVIREDILNETVRQLDGPTLKRVLIAAVTRFSAPYMQDFAMVCANWPVLADTAREGLDGAFEA